MVFAHACVLASASLIFSQGGAVSAPFSAETRAGRTEASSALAVAHGRVRFEANRGQVAAAARFLHRGAGYTLFLAPGEAVFALEGDAVVRMRIVGAREEAALVGREQLPGTVNYMRGAAPSGWIHGIPTFGRVECADVRPGIDLVYRGVGGSLEYDFVVAPGVDPGDLRLRFEGVSELSLEASGDLVLRTSCGALVHRAPVIYQERDGRREIVAGRFAVTGPREVGFVVGDYDPGRPLVIDPTVAFSSLLGGSGDDGATGVATDAAGNVYVAGYTASVDFPGAAGPPSGSRDAFVVKLDPTGSTILFATYLGGAASDSADGVAVDAAGNVYLAGDTQSNDFPITPGAFQAGFAGGFDLFVTKLDGLGGIVYSTYVGGSGNDIAFAFALGPADTVYVTGRTGSPDLPTTEGAYDSVLDGSNDAFLAIVDPAGNGALDLQYLTYLGGGLTEQSFGVAVDSAGTAYLIGSTVQEKTTQPRFPTTDDAYRSSVQLRKNTYLNSIFLTKIDPGGHFDADLVYSTFFIRNPGGQAGRAVAADDFGRAYVAGTCHDDFPTTAGAFDETYNGGQFFQLQDAFVAVVNTTIAGTAGLEYSTFLGGYDGEVPQAIAVEGATAGSPGTIHVAGVAVNVEPHPHEQSVQPFPTTGDAFQTATAGYGEGFYSKIQPAGNGAADLRFSTLLGGDQSEIVWSLALDAAGAVYLAGQTDSTNFAPLITSGAPAGGLDAFLMRIEFGGGGTPPAAPTALSATPVSSDAIDLDWTDNAGDEDGFELERSPDGAAWSLLDTLAADSTSYSDSGLAAATQYFYRVRAVNGSGSSAYSNTASATTLPDGGGGDVVADGEDSVAGSVTGSYTDTWTSDDAREEIRERLSNGNPANRFSFLEHKWTFDVPAGTQAFLNVEAHQTVSPDGDEFVFAWSTDGANYTDVLTVSATGGDVTYAHVAMDLPPGFSGTLYIRVRDTDQTSGNKGRDTVLIDHIFIGE
ncbi:MAG: hypothetical protein E2O39_07525 [Planctomycetota bacterium]|nr:MAG: hypothetical protein E2O39_07525 [Planctomycetota bacterium]